MSFKIKNIALFHLMRWIDVPLHGEEISARNTFVKTVFKQHEDFLNKRMQMMNDLSDKNAEGKPVILENGQVSISDENMKKFDELFNEVTEYPEIDKSVLKTLKRILTEKMQKGLGIKEGEIWTEIVSSL